MVNSLKYGNKLVGGPDHVPTGWDWWAGLIGNSKYYNYSLSINGTKKEFGNDSSSYLTDVIVSVKTRCTELFLNMICLKIIFPQSNMAVDFIKTRNSNSEPFLMVLAPPAPHAPFTPATRHIDAYKDVKAKRTPNFNTQTQMVFYNLQ